MEHWEFALIAYRVIEQEGFADFQPVAVFPRRAEVRVLAEIPEGVSHEEAALQWAKDKALEADDAEYLVALKVDSTHFKVVRVAGHLTSACIFKADGSELTTHYAVVCPACREEARALMVRTGTKGNYREAFVRFGASRITCMHCGHHREFANADGPYEFWYATEFRGRRLWACHRAQLEFMIAWLEGSMDTSRGAPASAYLEGLPKWLRSQRNREPILECLRGLLAR